MGSVLVLLLLGLSISSIAAMPFKVLRKLRNTADSDDELKNDFTDENTENVIDFNKFMDQFMHTLIHMERTLTKSLSRIDDAVSYSDDPDSVRAQIKEVFDAASKDVTWPLLKTYIEMNTEHDMPLPRAALLVTDTWEEIKDVIDYAVHEIDRIVERDAKAALPDVQEIIVKCRGEIDRWVEPLLELLAVNSLDLQ